MRTKVVIIQELFSSYRGPIFDRLSKKYEILVLHGKKKSDLKLIDKPYSKMISPKYLFNGRIVFLNVFSDLKKFRPDIVIHQGSPGILSLPFSWIWCKLNKVKFVVWTHGFERHQGFKPNRSFRSFLRLIYFKMSDAVIFYTKERRDFFVSILPQKKLFYATNTLDTTGLLELRDDLRRQDLSHIKKELNTDDYFNMVFIGRLLKDKLADHLIRVTAILKGKGHKIKTHIIGEGEESTSLKELSIELGLEADVVFYGAVYDEKFSSKILFASDLMVIPGYVGLAINHAFCFSLPVITYEQGIEGPFHSPEIDYLENGKTGLLTHSYDIENMVASIIKLLLNPELLNTYKLNVDKKIDELKIEKMEEGFSKCIDNTIEKKK